MDTAGLVDEAALQVRRGAPRRASGAGVTATEARLDGRGARRHGHSATELVRRLSRWPLRKSGWREQTDQSGRRKQQNRRAPSALLPPANQTARQHQHTEADQRAR
jgi:hypothetical protein